MAFYHQALLKKFNADTQSASFTIVEIVDAKDEVYEKIAEDWVESKIWFPVFSRITKLSLLVVAKKNHNKRFIRLFCVFILGVNTIDHSRLLISWIPSRRNQQKSKSRLQISILYRKFCSPVLTLTCTQLVDANYRIFKTFRLTYAIFSKGTVLSQFEGSMVKMYTPNQLMTEFILFSGCFHPRFH